MSPLRLQKAILILGSMLVLMFCASSVMATEDPLGKPKVWSKIKKMPIDSVLWAQYYGKAWVCMNQKETANIKKWQKELMDNLEIDHAAEEEISWDEPVANTHGKLAFVDHAVEEEKQRALQEKNVYIRDLEASYLREPTDVMEMKKNISKNFIIIEDWYEEQFDKRGLEYVFYEDRYPRGGYSKNQWIHEKERELKALKRQEFEKQKEVLAKESY